MSEALQRLVKELCSCLGRRQYDVSIAPNFPKEIEIEILRDFQSSKGVIDEAQELIEKIRAQMEVAEKEIEEALLELRKVYTKLVLKNEVAWEKQLSTLKRGVRGKLPNGDYVEVIDTSPDTGEVLVNVLNRSYLEQSEFANSGNRWCEFNDIEFDAIDDGEFGELLDIRDEKVGKYEELKAQPCPEPPCEHCGHSYCFDYHFRLSGSMSDWELICCSKTCPCIHCVEARKKTDTADRWQCCYCFGIRPKK